MPLEQLVPALLAAPEPRRVLVWREGMADWILLLVVLGSLSLLVAIAVTAYQLSGHLRESVPLLWAIVMFIPCFNLIGLLVLSSKATAWCSRYGLKVGLLGPTQESIEDLRQRMMTSPFE